MKHLKSTRDLARVLGGEVEALVGFVDAGNSDRWFATISFVLFEFGGAAVWGGKKQSSVATTTIEGEFIATSHAVKEASRLEGFLAEIGIHP